MLKKEVFKIEDSNVEAIGSDEDKKARMDAAGTEKAWEKAGKKPGLQIWRIEKFKVKASTTAAGTFYNDDSYICLNTYKKKVDGKEVDKLGFDVHFWLGETTSQDEYGTAAYKTVELDDFLGGDPVQHREVSGFESSLFLSYFKESGGVQLLEGGMESGFNHVKPEEYKPRLLHLKGKKNIRIEEMDIKMGSLNSGDVFILDNGLDIYQWQGKKAGMNERARAGQYCRSLDDQRKGKPEVHVCRQGDDDEIEKKFFSFFADAGAEISEDSGDDMAWEKSSTKSLYQLSDSSGNLEFKEVATGSVKKSMLNDDDVFIFDIGNEVFAWVGNGASAAEKKGALNYASAYLKKMGKNEKLPITRLFANADNEVFNSSFDKE